MAGFIFSIGFIIIVIAIIVVVSKSQQRFTKKILSKLEYYSFEKIQIRFLQSSVGKGSVVGGLPVKAVMYFSNDLILIAPKENGNFNGLFNFNLPVIIVKNKEKVHELEFGNVVVPDKINLSTWNSISIKYQKTLIGNIKYSIQINLLDKNDIEKIKEIKNWC